MGPKSCEICKVAPSKYKCPTCIVPYCSLACYKKHKEIPCTKPETSSEAKVCNPDSAPTGEKQCYTDEPKVLHDLQRQSTDSDPAPIDEKPCYIDEPTEVLQEMQLQSIASSTEIRDLIKDKNLQKLIHDIDCSVNADKVLDEAMEDAAFRLFTEKILSTIAP